MKIVINDCYGGFGLSHKGMIRYAEIKGFKLYAYTTSYDKSSEDYRKTILWDGTGNEPFFLSYSTSPELDGKNHFWKGDIERNDSALIQVVEELGAEANGNYSSLKIVEIPDDVKWHIAEYDGNEHVAEDHRTWY